ncbi:hypothetical protein Pla163_21320 [Planctomycetes bacterium Pla163]|uniref:Flippase-like domain-containing protein n=1 Tax=Rohdeia mirabilis TaxID=2528008 RepID=A0A518D0K4_9BACT|nr:hypothetical protein Pla163_21320 [Planctomycetes bacterium Pla163]
MSGARPHTLRRWLQPLFGVAILGLVMWFLPWRDVVVLSSPGADRTAIELIGAFDENWKTEATVFDVAPDGRPGTWPDWLPQNLPQLELVLADDADAKKSWSVVGLPGVGVDIKPGMPRVFKSVELKGLVWALGCFLTALLFAITRWWRLLKLAGCQVKWWSAFRLSYLGLFFNLVMPGLTGGDVVKAVLAVRENPGKRPDALVSVVVDRLMGMFALAFLASVVILVADSFAELRPIVPPIMLVMLVGALVYTSRRVRKLLRFDALIERLPMAERIKSLDAAVVAYRRRPLELLLAFALSMGNHFLAVVGVMGLGAAFGVPDGQIGLVDYLAIVPVANMVSSIPITPGGWGVGEAAYGSLFQMVGVAASLGVAVSVGFRLCQMLIGFAGGLYLLKPGASATAREGLAEAEVVEAESAATN